MPDDDDAPLPGGDFGSDVVLELREQVEPLDVDQQIRYREFLTREQRARTILRAWATQQREERGLRKFYAQALFIALGVELTATFAAFFLIGRGWLHFDRWVVETFLNLALVQTAGLVGVVVRYLFPNRSASEVAGLIAVVEEDKPRASDGTRRKKLSPKKDSHGPT